MGVFKVHGFRMGESDFKSDNNGFVVSEVVRVESDNPTDTLAAVIFGLPNFASGPGPLSFNPQQLTFTITQSRHPDGPDYILQDVVRMSRTSTEDRFWDIGLVYATARPSDSPSSFGGSSGSPGQSGKKSQRMKKPDSKKPEDNEPIVNPLERPAIWTGNSSVTMRNSFFDLSGNRILHTNKIPVDQPISIPVAVRNWTWNFNVDAKEFEQELEPGLDYYFNKCNSTQLNITIGNNAIYPVAPYRLKMVGYNCTEEWETPSQGDTEYHYVKVTVKFQVAVDPWNTAPLSMHTKEYIGVGPDPYKPIVINDLGDETRTPWPLKPDGTAIPFADLATATDADFGKLQANGADLVVCQDVDFQPMFSRYSLTLPRRMD